VSISRRIRVGANKLHTIWNDGPESPTYVLPDTIRRATPVIEKLAANFLSEALYSDIKYHLLGGLCGSVDKWAEREHEYALDRDRAGVR
jgi:hypothetical protein